MLRFIRIISQSVGALAVFGIVSTSVAVANPTTTAPTSATTTAASTVATNPTNLGATAINPDDVAQAGPLSDVPQGHWAYDAVAQLAKDGLIKGYPDGTFKGNRPMTRYEAAVLTYRAVDEIEAQITAGKVVEQADIDSVKKLLAAFGNELKAVEAHVDTLDKSVTGVNQSVKALKAEADATQLRVNQGKVGFNLVERPGTSYYNVSVTNGGPVPALGANPGNLVQSGTVGFGPGGLNPPTAIGPQAHGVNYTLARFFLGGQMDPRWSYGLRVSDKLVNENATGNTSVSPSFCTFTSTNCSFSDLNNGSGTNPLNLDFAYLQYSSPGGLTSQIGRYSVGSYGRYATSPTNLVFAGQQITGGNLGYNDPHGHIYAAVYYGIPSVSSATLQANASSVCSQNVVGLNYASNSLLPGAQGNFNGINPRCNSTQQDVGAWLGYYFTGPRVFIGGSSENFKGKQYTFYNPSAINCKIGAPAQTLQATSATTCTQNGGIAAPSSEQGNYVTGEGDPQLVEAYLAAYFGPKAQPKWDLALAYDRHIGTNPFTGGAYASANAYAGSLTFASKGNVFGPGSNNNAFYPGTGRKDSNVAQVEYAWYGLNSLGGIEAGNYLGTLAYTNNSGITNPNGLYDLGISVGHWFTDNVRFSIDAYHIQNHANIPVGTNGTANTTCPGCYVSSLQQNQINAEMYMYFF